MGRADPRHAGGWLSDRSENRWLLCWYYGLRGLSLRFLPYALGSENLALAAFIVFCGLDWVAAVPPTVRLAAGSVLPAEPVVVRLWFSEPVQAVSSGIVVLALAGLLASLAPPV